MSSDTHCPLCERPPMAPDRMKAESCQCSYEDLEAALREAKRSLSEGIRWIPVSERLPEPNVLVLAIESSAAVVEQRTIAHYSPGPPKRHMLATDWIDAWGEYIDASHWMPLPETPKC